MSLAPVSGGVLIGGASSRMGRPKALLRVGRHTFLEHVLGVLRSRCPRVVLVGDGLPRSAARDPLETKTHAGDLEPTRPGSANRTAPPDGPDECSRTLERSLAGVERIADAAGICGPLAGVLAALRTTPRNAWLIAAVDLPRLRGAALDWLLAQRAPGVIAVLPSLAPGRVEPLLAVYEPAALEILELLALDPTRGLRPLATQPGVLTPTPPPDLRGCWRNINTPGEYARLESEDRAPRSAP